MYNPPMSLSETKKRLSLVLSGLTALALACNLPILAKQSASSLESSPPSTPDLSPTQIPPFPCNKTTYPTDMLSVMPTDFLILIPTPEQKCSFILQYIPAAVALVVNPESLSLWVMYPGWQKFKNVANDSIPTPDDPASLSYPLTGISVAVALSDPSHFYTVHTETDQLRPSATPVILQPMATLPAGN